MHKANAHSFQDPSIPFLRGNVQWEHTLIYSFQNSAYAYLCVYTIYNIHQQCKHSLQACLIKLFVLWPQGKKWHFTTLTFFLLLQMSKNLFICLEIISVEVQCVYFAACGWVLNLKNHLIQIKIKNALLCLLLRFYNSALLFLGF